jgi:hypothetical protein
MLIIGRGYGEPAVATCTATGVAFSVAAWPVPGRANWFFLEVKIGEGTVTERIPGQQMREFRSPAGTAFRVAVRHHRSGGLIDLVFDAARDEFRITRPAPGAVSRKG